MSGIYNQPNKRHIAIDLDWRRRAAGDVQLTDTAILLVVVLLLCRWLLHFSSFGPAVYFIVCESNSVGALPFLLQRFITDSRREKHSMYWENIDNSI